MHPHQEYGDVRTVAEITQVSVSHLNKLRLYDSDNSPPFVRFGRRVVYRLKGPNSLESWLEARTKGGADRVGVA